MSSTGLKYTPLQSFSFRPNRWHITSDKFACELYVRYVTCTAANKKFSLALLYTCSCALSRVSKARFASTEIPFCQSFLHITYLYTHLYRYINKYIDSSIDNTGMSTVLSYVFLIQCRSIPSSQQQSTAARLLCIHDCPSADAPGS